MIPAGTMTFFLIMGSAFCASMLAVLLMRSSKPNLGNTRSLVQGAESRPVFLFDDESIIDMTDPARELFARLPRRGSDWATLASELSKRFPTLCADVSSLASEGETTVAAAAHDDLTEIHAEWWDGTVRLELKPVAGGAASVHVDRQCQIAMETELSLLRHAVTHAPVAMWQTDRDGAVGWANNQYLELSGNDSGWPPAIAFPGIEHHPYETPGAAQRLRSETGGDWYDVQSSTYQHSQISFAVSAEAEVEAENARREFIQTLSKTFAHLAVGLAVFDKNRQLVLFNPALTDLLTLPVDFLSSRPTLFSVLDRLRDRRMIPEPKDYKNWREEMAALESAATHGTYQETWSLPGGQTYRVIGRPYPDGAIALQVEDITPEVSLTRNFRSELELSQAVFDSLPYAMAVFSPGGILTLSNKGYADLWGNDPSTTLGEISATEALGHWRAAEPNDETWKSVELYIKRLGERRRVQKVIERQDGTPLRIELRALPGGASLVAFHQMEEAARTPETTAVTE